MLDDDNALDDSLRLMAQLLRRIDDKAPKKAVEQRKHVAARQHSPERELALVSVLTALRRVSHVRLADSDLRLNECARDWILREIQAERALAHRSPERSDA